MPLLIEHIDRLAREKKRTVLFVSFESINSELDLMSMAAPNHSYSDFENDINRQELIAWLDSNGIAWQPCAHFASENALLSYSGNIYVDVPWDEDDPQFVKFQERLETSDGTPRNPQVKIWACSLEDAMKNAHHDEPGFWEKWAETF